MKKFALLLTVFLLQQSVFSQGNVGIGTNAPDASAMLDITSTNKGVLVPRVYLLSAYDKVTIPSPAHSLLVYNETTSMPSGKGFYYNTGTPASPVWKPVSDVKLPYYNATSDSLPAFRIDNYRQYYGAVAVKGLAMAGRGVEGESTSGLGVIGKSNTGNGIVGMSSSGTGVAASSVSGYALETVGKIKISGGNTNPGAGKVLTSDASGNATWQNNKIGFRAQGVNPNYRTIPHWSYTKVEFGAEDYDLGNSYNLLAAGAPTANSSTFTVTVPGIYNLNAQIAPDDNLVFDYDYVAMRFRLKRNGVVSELARTLNYVDETDANYVQLNTDAKLLPGDQVWVEYFQANTVFSSSEIADCNSCNFFSARLIFAD